jgi:hypothetical protein
MKRKTCTVGGSGGRVSTSERWQHHVASSACHVVVTPSSRCILVVLCRRVVVAPSLRRVVITLHL